MSNFVLNLLVFSGILNLNESLVLVRVRIVLDMPFSLTLLLLSVKSLDILKQLIPSPSSQRVLYVPLQDQMI